MIVGRLAIWKIIFNSGHDKKNCQSIAMPVKKYIILDKFYPTCKSKKNVTKAAADH
jgi:hypothetical protein